MGMGKRGREMGEWEGNGAASCFPQALQAPQGPAVAKDCRGLPRGLPLPARSLSRAAWYRQKLPLAALAGREQFDSSACFASWHGRSRWEDILAQLEESVLNLGVLFFLFFFFFETTVNASNTMLGCS